MALGRPVLVVDDDPAARAALADALLAEGYGVVFAYGPVSAVALARACRPVALVLASARPQRWHADLCGRVRRDPDLARLPLVGLGGGPARPRRQRPAVGGAEDQSGAGW